MEQNYGQQFTNWKTSDQIANEVSLRIGRTVNSRKVRDILGKGMKDPSDSRQRIYPPESVNTVYFALINAT